MKECPGRLSTEGTSGSIKRSSIVQKRWTSNCDTDGIHSRNYGFHTLKIWKCHASGTDLAKVISTVLYFICNLELSRSGMYNIAIVFYFHLVSAVFVIALKKCSNVLVCANFSVKKFDFQQIKFNNKMFSLSEDERKALRQWYFFNHWGFWNAFGCNKNNHTW